MAYDDLSVEDECSGELPSDPFYRGSIVKLYQGRRGGVLRADASGREITFEFLHVTVLGERRRFEDLHEGMHVGYDVGWTSHGLRVTLLRLED